MNAPPASLPSAPSNGFNPNNQSAALQMQLASLLSTHPMAAALLSNTSIPMQPHPTPMSQQPQQQPFPSTSALNGLGALGALFGTQQTQGATESLQWGQLLADAMRLNTPVGSYSDDEDRLIAALYDSEVKGSTYRHALDGLHGVNNHAANLWKDYYLDHTPRINELVARKRRPLVAKKPCFDTLGGRHAVSDAHKTVVPSNNAHSSDAEKHEKHSHASVSRRTSSATLYESSVTAWRVPTIKPKEEGIIRAPRRSPTPPSTAVPNAKRGFKFTDEDQSFFVKYVRYRLEEDPTLNKSALCSELARKCPHHSANSWQSHWNLHREQYELLLPSISRTRTRSGRQTNNDDTGDTDSEGYDVDSESDYESQSEQGSDGEAEEDTPDKYQGIEDLDKMAEYIASIGSEWDGLKRREQWEPFQLQYPHRTWPAWAERYRKNKAEIHEMVADLTRAQNSVREQRAIPSWARDHKRSLSDGKRGEVDSRQVKRVKLIVSE